MADQDVVEPTYYVKSRETGFVQPVGERLREALLARQDENGDPIYEDVAGLIDAGVTTAPTFTIYENDAGRWVTDAVEFESKDYASESTITAAIRRDYPSAEIVVEEGSQE